MRWNVVPLYAIAKQKKIVNCIGRELLSVYLGIGVIPFSKMTDKRTNVTSADLSKYQAVDYGDFVLNNQQAWRGSVGVSKYSGIVSPAYIVLEINDALQTQYANYLFQSRSMIDQYVVCSKGVGSIQRNIYWDYLKRITVALPPRDEQDQIVRYLDWKVSQINKLINAKKKLIGLLGEQKRAIIEEALKKIDSQQTLLGYLGALQNGISASGDFFTEGTPFVNYGDVYKNEILPSTVSGAAKATAQQQKTYSVEYGDVFFTRTSETIEEIGLSSVCNETIPQAVFSGFVIRFRPQKGIIHNGYARYFFRSKRVRDYFTKEMNLVTRVSLGQTLLKNLPVLLPDIKTQKIIATQLDERCSLIDTLTASLNNEIALLSECRTRLSSDVVTGKLDVRGAVIPDHYIARESIEPVDEFAEDMDNMIGGECNE